MEKDDKLKIGDKFLSSRLLVGTGKLPNALLPGVIAASGTEVVTVALRRADFHSPQENPLSFIPEGITIMPNTSGARNAERRYISPGSPGQLRELGENRDYNRPEILVPG